jgi:hypothetical protein
MDWIKECPDQSRVLLDPLPVVSFYLLRVYQGLLDDNVFLVNNGKIRRSSGRNRSVFYWRPSPTST